ncbi:rRNA maturation RNase YbeY [Patescibacteria group bacterium]
MLDIKKTVRKEIVPISGLFLRKLKKEVLGEDYGLSLVFIGDKLSNRLNLETRNIDKPTNILSFPLSKTEGEIFINLNLSKKQAPRFNKSYKDFVAYLFIHGLLHLKGFEHGSRMNSEETKLVKKFNL